MQEGFASGVEAQHPVAQVLARTIGELMGQPPAFEMCPGLLETRWYVRQGSPAFAYGPEYAHGPDERIEIKRIYQHTAIYALAALRLLTI